MYTSFSKSLSFDCGHSQVRLRFNGAKMDGASLKLSEESAKAYIKEQLKLIENYTYLIDSFLAVRKFLSL